MFTPPELPPVWFIAGCAPGISGFATLLLCSKFLLLWSLLLFRRLLPYQVFRKCLPLKRLHDPRPLCNHPSKTKITADQQALEKESSNFLPSSKHAGKARDFSQWSFITAFALGMAFLTAAYASGRINPRYGTSAPYAGDDKGRVLYLNGRVKVLDFATCMQIN